MENLTLDEQRRLRALELACDLYNDDIEILKAAELFEKFLKGEKTNANL